MNDQNLAQFEAKLERLIEGAFAQMFSKTVRAQDIALQLARAMENGAAAKENGDPRPLAPDHYTIRMNPAVRARLLERQPALAQILSQHMVELCTEAGYRLNNVPLIDIVDDYGLNTGDLNVQAEHINRQHSITEAFLRVDLPVPERAEPKNAQLIINGESAVPLQAPIVNIGRSRENHIVLDDPYVSRHHAQLRLRFGRYTLFDIQSQTGTFVNDIRVREHPLQPGDVIRMGRMQVVYLEDDAGSDSQTGADLPLDL
jgi:hypothetical protein